MKPGETKIIPPRGVQLNEIHHVCIVVRDAEDTATKFAEMGIGPFTVRMVETPEERASVRGEPTSYTLKFAYAQAGPIVLELVEPVQGHSHYSEFLDEYGEGIHHIGFKSPDQLDGELQRWQQEGIEPLQINRREDTRYGWAYMDTEDLVGCTLEVVCDPPLGWWESKALADDLDGPLQQSVSSEKEEHQ